MPKFSQDSFSKLSTCDHDLQVLFFEVIKTYDCKILEGYRNQEDQEKAFNSGHSKLHFPHGKHNHQPSYAVDAAPYPLDWNDKLRFYHFAGYVLAVADQLKSQGKMTKGIRWGGNWDMDNDLMDNKFSDLGHFELIL